MTEAVQQKTSNVVVRRAKPGDKTAVLDVNRNVYDGFDYLPSLYDTLMLDENYTYYVAEVDNTVVAFYGVCLIDGGKTLMARSGRVRADFEGQGLLGHILRVVYRDFSPLYHVTPDLKMAIAIGDTCALINRAHFRSVNELIWKRALKVFKCDLRSMSTTSSAPNGSRPAPSVKELGQEDFVQLVDAMNSSQRQHFFPKDVFTTFTWHFDLNQLASSRNVWGRWDPYFTATSSLAERVLLPGTELRQADDASKKLCQADQDRSSCSGLLTASMTVKVPSGTMTFLDIFGSITEREDLKDHLKQIVLCLPNWSMKLGNQADNLHVLVCTNTNEEGEMITQELELLGFEDADYRMKEMYYFWQSFDTLNAS